MNEPIRKRIELAYWLMLRAVQEGREEAACFYGRLLGRNGLYFLSQWPEIFNY